MAGGLLQLVAYGAQDVYLTSNPQITFFKVVYRRHTNFSIESIKQTFNGTADFGQEVSVTVQRNADLIHKVYFQTDIPQIDVGSGLTDSNYYRAFRWLNWLGHILLKTMTLSIGGQTIDKHYGEWLHLWNELSCPEGKKEGYAEMVGNIPRLTHIHSTNSTISNTCIVGGHTLYVPLQFWFCRNAGLSLPLVALQYSDININIELSELKDCIWAVQQKNTDHNHAFGDLTHGPTALGTTSSIALSNTNLYIDYIYLDTDERRRFAKTAHEYLIETLKYNGGETVSSSNPQVKLNFTHPVKELVWIVQPTNFKKQDYTQTRGGNQNFNYTDLWDYTGFTGTPEGANGIGMKGGKNSQNYHKGFNELNVEGNLNTNNSWATTKTTISSVENAGYTNVSNYTLSSSVNTYSSRRGLWFHSSNERLDEGNNTVSKAKLVLNGNDRISERNGSYFNLIQPYQHHTNIPAPGINVYSFALNPEDHQPSGTCNFSRIDNAFINLTLTDNTISSTSSNGYNSGNAHVRVYATNYNILRIMSGMGGLAYSN